MMFILIIWLQGIWLPQHGYSFTQTPLWAAIYMVPMTVGFLIAGPVSGLLSDRYGARPFATSGMIAAALSFGLLELLPINFSYVWFALLLLMSGLAMGLFSSPNRAGVMNSLPGTMYRGLVAHGVPAHAAHQVAGLPAVSTLFASFLGYNPVQNLLGPTGVLAHLPHAQAAFLTGRSFFPSLISGPFGEGLHAAFDFALVACVVAAVASLLRGGKYHHGDELTGSSALDQVGVDVPEASVPAGAPSPGAGSRRG